MTTIKPIRTLFEDLPDEIFLLICRYLSQINILDSFSQLNKRYTQTITFYRENIFLSHLTYNELQHFLDDHLVKLSTNVLSLYINNSSMLNLGKIFERKFSKIDQEFPRLTRLDFHQIDIETLENLSWRFNTMTNLRQLNIDLTKDRLSSMPIQFDEFLCGKLFSSSNSFQYLSLNLDDYLFNLHSLTQISEQLRCLTISVKHLNDLLVLFDHLPHLEQLTITIGCSLTLNMNYETYFYDHLWWKVSSLTKFSLTIEEKNLTSHEHVLSHRYLFQIIENLYFLTDLKFSLDIKFTSTLFLTTTKDIYTDKYLPFLDGTLWEQALKRNDHRMMYFQYFFRLDGMDDQQFKRMKHSDGILYDRTDHFNVKSLLKSTFSSAFWLQKNLIIECLNCSSIDISIYTSPMRRISRTITSDILEQDLALKTPSMHVNIEELNIISNADSSLPLSLKDLLAKYPRLIHLRFDSNLILPPTISISSHRLRSLSLMNYSLNSSCQLLEYFPQVLSLTIRCSSCERLNLLESSSNGFSRSITRLKLILDSYHSTSLINIKQYFPNFKEFYLMIKSISSGSLDSFRQCVEFEELNTNFNQLRYMEISLPIKQGFLVLSTRETSSETNQISRMKTFDGHYLILKYWL